MMSLLLEIWSVYILPPPAFDEMATGFAAAAPAAAFSFRDRRRVACVPTRIDRCLVVLLTNAGTLDIHLAVMNGWITQK